jgi:hypothetical protein
MNRGIKNLTYIQNLNNRIMKLTEQSHILSHVVQKGYMYSALSVSSRHTECVVGVERGKNLS